MTPAFPGRVVYVLNVYVLNNATIGFRRSSESSGNSCGDQDEQVLFDLTDPNHQENLIVLMGFVE